MPRFVPICSLSFFSLVFLFPWCFSCCKINLSFGAFSSYFPGLLRVCKVREILGVFEVFPGVFEKRKEKKDRVLICSDFFRFDYLFSENKSEQIRETTFFRSLLQVSDFLETPTFGILLIQAVLQGVAFMGVQVLR